MITLVTARERYSVNAQGDIGRPEINMPPSGRWKFSGIVRHNNFGRVVEFVGADRIMAGFRPERMRYRNGKSIWRVRDVDCGTCREWGEPLIAIAEDHAKLAELTT